MKVSSQALVLSTSACTPCCHGACGWRTFQNNAECDLEFTHHIRLLLTLQNLMHLLVLGLLFVSKTTHSIAQVAILCFKSTFQSSVQFVPFGVRFLHSQWSSSTLSGLSLSFLRVLGSRSLAVFLSWVLGSHSLAVFLSFHHLSADRSACLRGLQYRSSCRAVLPAVPLFSLRH